ncbi:MAG TPA: hypothetical protein VMO26_07415 [Vicinamibacterales bacterium]|nr:hypothetical protein [Vicinamibacterales bacterium]
MAVPLDLRVAAVFSGMGQEATAKTEVLHRAFERLYRKSPELFPGMTFVTLSDYPHSPQLESALFKLQNAGVIGVFNPRYEKLEIRSERLESVLGRIRLTDQSLVAQLQELGASARAELTVAAR